MKSIVRLHLLFFCSGLNGLLYQVVGWPGNLDTSMTTPFARGLRLTSGVAIASALLARMTVLMGGTFTILILARALPRIARDGTPRGSTRHRFGVGSRRHPIPSLTYGRLEADKLFSVRLKVQLKPDTTYGS